MNAAVLIKPGSGRIEQWPGKYVRNIPLESLLPDKEA